MEDIQIVLERHEQRIRIMLFSYRYYHKCNTNIVWHFLFDEYL